MKVKTLLSMAIAVTTVITGTGLVSPHRATGADSNKYMCAQRNGIWTTFARLRSGGVVSLIRWVDTSISEWPPQRRCLEVSKRFQAQLSAGRRVYVIPGEKNGLPAICTTARRGGGCDSLLLTLKPGEDPFVVRDQLLGLNKGATGMLYRAPEDLDMEDYLNCFEADVDDQQKQPYCAGINREEKVIIPETEF